MKLISAATVREKLGGCSDMHIWRLQNNPMMNFPRPTYLNRRRLWDADEIDQWLATLLDARDANDAA